MACEARMQKCVGWSISAVCLIRFAWPMKPSCPQATISEIRSRPCLMGIVVDSFTCFTEPFTATGLVGTFSILAAFIVCVGCVVLLLDVSILIVALLRISDGLGVSISGLQWIVAAYKLAFATFLLTAGTAGDRYGN